METDKHTHTHTQTHTHLLSPLPSPFPTHHVDVAVVELLKGWRVAGVCGTEGTGRIRHIDVQQHNGARVGVAGEGGV